MADASVAVIIAAHNAETTIRSAIQSALREPEVSEVVVIDDCSTDGTAEAARLADDGSGRLTVRSLTTNQGPARARNLAIEASTAPFIAILDADDRFLEGRMCSLLSQTDWDLIGDNIAFVRSGSKDLVSDQAVPRFDTATHLLTPADFIRGNLSKPGISRGELGFLKPVVRRAFLDRHRLRYREDLRLGEDYELYCRALFCGARYKISRRCGYLAVVSEGSLSGRHRTADLGNLADADLDLKACPDLTPDIHAALDDHWRQLRDKYLLRRFLDIKAKDGLASALRFAFSDGTGALSIGGGVLRDKVRHLRGRFERRVDFDGSVTIRTLLPGSVPQSERL